MSFHRENVIWQSKDKTWSIGFFEVIDSVYGYEEDYDPEWDVEYNFEDFEWVSNGHPSQEAARLSWKGANPGSHAVYPYSKNTRERIEEYDEMSKCYHDPVYAEKRRKAQDRAQLKNRHSNLLDEKRNILKEGNNVYFGVGQVLGISRGMEGVLRRNGAWLCVDKQRVYNVETGKLWIGTRKGEPVGITALTALTPADLSWFIQ